jgi:hypothetical protein
MQQGRSGRVDGNVVIVLQADLYQAGSAARACSTRHERTRSSAENDFALSYINKEDAPTDLLINIV